MNRTWKTHYSGDLLITGMASWFGGGSDPDDNGETASGVKNDGSDPNLLGCALPMAWDGARVDSCQASPIPFLPWHMLVEIKADNGKIITVPLIDVGPALNENRPIDLTVAAFKALGGNLSAGLLSVSFRILTTGINV